MRKKHTFLKEYFIYVIYELSNSLRCKILLPELTEREAP